jgi:lipoprotein-releasing system ATP-binding protein
MSKTTPALELQKIKKSYGDLAILHGVSLTIKPGEAVALVGPSGAGKSTLLHIAGLLDTATTGHIQIHGRKADGLSDRQRTHIRQKTIGFVYQFHHLLPEFTALENVILPQLIGNCTRDEASKKAHQLLKTMGLSHRLSHRPSQMSGGEQQRVAIARALANSPSLLLADEPTGNLDTKTSAQVFDELIRLTKETNVAALIATHNPALAKAMDRTITLVDGKLTE